MTTTQRINSALKIFGHRLLVEACHEVTKLWPSATYQARAGAKPIIPDNLETVFAVNVFNADTSVGGWKIDV
jgi:hypothetical protein